MADRTLKLTPVDEELDLSGLTPVDEELDLSAVRSANSPPSVESSLRAPEPAEESEGPSTLESIGRGAAQGFTFKAGDEISGALGALIYGSNLQDDARPGESILERVARGYRESRDAERRANAAAKAAHPVAYGVSTGLAMAPAAIATGGGAAAAGLGRAGLAALGAGEGAVQAFYGSEGNVGDQLTNTAIGAGTGGAAAAAPLVGLGLAGYGLTQGDAADRSEALTGLLTGVTAQRLGAKRGQRLEENTAARDAAVTEAQAPNLKPIADLETDLSTSQGKLAAEEAQARSGILESDAEAQNAAAQRAAAEKTRAAKQAVAERIRAAEQEMAALEAREAEAAAAAGRQADEQNVAEQQAYDRAAAEANAFEARQAAARKARANEARAQAERQALEQDVAEQTQYNEASRAAADFAAQEKVAQAAYKDFRSILVKAEAGDVRAQAALEKVRSNLITEFQKLEAAKARVELQAKGKLGNAVQSEQAANALYKDVPAEALSPEAQAGRARIQAEMVPAAERRYTDPSAKELAEQYRSELEGDLAADEASINRRWNSLDEQAPETTPGNRPPPSLERFRELLVAEAKKRNLDTGPDDATFDLLSTPSLKGERPVAPVAPSKDAQKLRRLSKISEAVKAAEGTADEGAKPEVPAKPSPAAQKLRKQQLMMEAVKAFREGNKEKAAELAKAASEAAPEPVSPELVPTRAGEGPLTAEQAQRLDTEMGPKRAVAQGKQEKTSRALGELRAKNEPQAIIARGKEAAKAAEKDKLSLSDISINPKRTILNVGAKLFSAAKTQLNSPEARAAFHDAVVKELESSSISPKQLEQSGRLLSAFAAGRISAAALSAYLEKDEQLAKAVGSALGKEKAP